MAKKTGKFVSNRNPALRLVVRAVKPTDILNALAPQPLDAAVYAELSRYHEELKNRRDQGLMLRNLLDLTLEKALAVEGRVPSKECIVASRLRELVDEWLETGRAADGTESPLRRNLFQTILGIRAVEKWAEKKPLELLLLPEISQVVVAVGAPQATPVTFPQSFDFFQNAIDEADWLFTGLIVSGWKEHLCKCRYSLCGGFFTQKPRLKSCPHGTFCCREHRNRASAAKHTRQRRDEFTRGLIEFAGKYLRGRRVNSPQWQNDRRLKADLVVALSRYALDEANPKIKALRRVVKANWVTRHQLEIEEVRKDLAPDRSARQVGPHAPR